MNDDATAVFPDELASGEAPLHPLRSLAERLGRELHLEDFRSGQWFPKLVAAWLRHDEAQSPRRPWSAQASHPSTTQRIIHRACVETALTGAGCGAVSTGATLVIAETGPAWVLAAVPIAGLAIGGEMVLRALVHLRMTCDLASAFGVRFDPDDPSDVSRLYALVFKTEEHRERDSGQDLLDRLVHSEPADLGAAIGAKLLGESVARNIVPFIGIAASSLTNWRRTQHLAEIVLPYVRFRRALDDSFEAVRQRWEEGVELLIEGAWFLFTADKPLNEEEAAVLTHLLRRAGPGVRRRIMRRLVDDDPADWLHRLRTVPERTRDAFAHALTVASAADLEIPAAERRLLRQARQALKRPPGRQDMESLLEQFRAAGVVPAFAGAEAAFGPVPEFETGGLERESPRGEA